MHRTRVLLSAVIAGSLVSACAAETPTDPSSAVHSRPALSNAGGGYMGNGGKVASDSTTTTAASDAGGGWMGGGGKVAPDTIPQPE